MISQHILGRSALIGGAVAVPAPVFAVGGADSGDTAWLMICAALVLFMAIPGLALFYSGMVRAKNVLSILIQCFSISVVISVLWVAYGYSLAFGEGDGWVGGGEHLFLSGIGRETLRGTVPEAAFALYQLMFAVVTVALLIGAFAERMRFKALLCFIVAWFSLCYVPVAHWVWGGGWLEQLGVLDFAGGTVVHVASGAAGLACALFIGPRLGYGDEAMPPASLAFVLVGASMLWVGWFGFNGGSGLEADGVAAYALVVTQLGAAAGAGAWAMCEWARNGRAGVLGVASGAVAGLVAVTPAAGYIAAPAALAFGLVAGIACYVVSVLGKESFGYDDTLDVFGIHCIAGIVGGLLTGVLCAPVFGGVGFGGEITRVGIQVAAQLVGVVAVAAYSFGMTYGILYFLDSVVRVRAKAQDEIDGLDSSSHGHGWY